MGEEESENRVFHAKDIFMTCNFGLAGFLGAQRTSSRLELGLAQLWAAQRNSPWLELCLVRHSCLVRDQNLLFSKFQQSYCEKMS